MKSQKGITLISLTIYVIVMAVVVGTVAIISTFFYSNINDIDETISPIIEYTKFNSFFADEINHSNIKILECGITDNGQNYIIFDNGVQYTYIPENQGIYRNQVKICRGITDCIFKRTIEDGKETINVEFTVGEETRETKYTLKN